MGPGVLIASAAHSVDSSAILLAQGVAASDPAATWLNYGLAGLVILALIFGQLAPGRTLDREIKRADAAEAENRRIQEHVTETLIPLLTRALVALERTEDHRDRRQDGEKSPP